MGGEKRKEKSAELKLQQKVYSYFDVAIKTGAQKCIKA